MAYTIRYTTTGQVGYLRRDVTNWYGRFATKGEAEEWLRRNPVRDGKIVREC
jgi:hypothetical protein